MAIFLVSAIALLVLAVLPVIRNLTANTQNDERAGTATPSKKMVFAGFAFLGVIPVAAAFTYLAIGEPGEFNPTQQVEPQTPDGAVAAVEAMAPEERRAMIENMVAGLEERLATDPNDLEGWRMLARSHGVMGAHDKALTAWRTIVNFNESEIADWRGLAAALISYGAGSETSVTAELEGILVKIFNANPDDPMALFFLGVAAREKGDDGTALNHWLNLRQQLPENAPILPQLDQMIDAVR